MASKKKVGHDRPNLTNEQQQFLSLILEEGARLERRTIIDTLKKYESETISVKLLIEALEKVK